jgi:hypothetical protein
VTISFSRTLLHRVSRVVNDASDQVNTENNDNGLLQKLINELVIRNNYIYKYLKTKCHGIQVIYHTQIKHFKTSSPSKYLGCEVVLMVGDGGALLLSV